MASRYPLLARLKLPRILRLVDYSIVATISLDSAYWVSIMNFDPWSSEANFDPVFMEAEADRLLPSVVEASIVQAIVEGSGGPENTEMTDPGLRFVRHLLSISRPARHGFVPNFKDMAIIRQAARQFIRRCGGATLAIQAMMRITQCEQA